MAQYDFGTIDPNVKTGTELAADLNQWKTALHSSHAGVAPPAYAVPGMLWVDQTGGAEWRLTIATPSGNSVIVGVNPTTNQTINRFSDGTASAPGITWWNDPGTGFYRSGSGATTVTSLGAAKITFGPSSVDSTVPIRNTDGTAAAPGISWANAVSSGWYRANTDTFSFAIGGQAGVTFKRNALTHQQVLINGGGNANLPVGIPNSTLYLEPAAAGVIASIGFATPSATKWAINALSSGSLAFGGSTAAGPAALLNYACIMLHDGNIHARTFNQATVLMSSAVPVSGALGGLLGLRGVRYTDGETGLPGIGLELAGLEARFPEVVSALEAGKSINYTGLLGAIVEALRELDARVKILEGTASPPAPPSAS